MRPITDAAAIGDGTGGFVIDEIEVRAPQAGEVRVSLRAAGVCHTDQASLTWPGPLVLGHEGAGVVESVGEGVRHFEPGQPVLLNACRCTAAASRSATFRACWAAGVATAAGVSVGLAGHTLLATSPSRAPWAGLPAGWLRERRRVLIGLYRGCGLVPFGLGLKLALERQR